VRESDEVVPFVVPRLLGTGRSQLPVYFSFVLSNIGKLEVYR
jgi:hypothetical protein